MNDQALKSLAFCSGKRFTTNRAHELSYIITVYTKYEHICIFSFQKRDVTLKVGTIDELWHH